MLEDFARTYVANAQVMVIQENFRYCAAQKYRNFYSKPPVHAQDFSQNQNYKLREFDLVMQRLVVF